MYFRVNVGWQIRLHENIDYYFTKSNVTFTGTGIFNLSRRCSDNDPPLSSSCPAGVCGDFLLKKLDLN